MESESAHPAFISVVVTVRNESLHLAGLLDSLIRQAPPFEIVVVDAESRDATFDIAQRYARIHPGVVRALRQESSRGEGRNIGVRAARGAFIAFIDGDCVADLGWLAAVREGSRRGTIVAGRTVPIRASKFGELERVELYLAGSDVTYPSCNLGYPRDLFERLGGFDRRFVTAEDIDLNLRAVREGASIYYAPEAVVRAIPRSSWPAFLRQAFWNGFGRKQLTEKHGQLWDRYRIERLAADQRGFPALMRLGAALAGYLARVLTGGGDRLDRTPA